MSTVNSIYGASASYSTASSYSVTSKNTDGKTVSKTESASSSSEEIAAYYEKSSTVSDIASSQGTSGLTAAETIAKMKKDADDRMSSLKSLVENMMTKQGKAISNSTDWLTALKNGTLNVDEDTVNKAKEDVSEDGYWGVNKTSDRLVDFAKALSGGDSSKAEELMDAIQKGFDAATKTWGDDLPQLCQDTLKATMDKMTAWMNGTEDTDSDTDTSNS